jgi:hypothetical protein
MIFFPYKNILKLILRKINNQMDPSDIYVYNNKSIKINLHLNMINSVIKYISDKYPIGNKLSVDKIKKTLLGVRNPNQTYIDIYQNNNSATDILRAFIGHYWTTTNSILYQSLYYHRQTDTFYGYNNTNGIRVVNFKKEIFPYVVDLFNKDRFNLLEIIKKKFINNMEEVEKYTDYKIQSNEMELYPNDMRTRFAEVLEIIIIDLQ